MTRKGKIKFRGVKLRKHELATVCFLVNRGYNIELIPKIDIKGVHTPDMWMNGIAWEMKSPCGKGNSVIKNNLQIAARQSKNVVIDLRRIKRNEDKSLHEIEKEFNYSKNLERIKIITKGGRIMQKLKKIVDTQPLVK